jgi:hypothetical protein
VTEAWVDRQGDVWRLGEDGLMHSPETAPFPREYVEKKWGPLRPVREVVVDERPACPRCGGPMNAGVAFLCGPDGGAGLPLPARCIDPECTRADQKARDEAAIERAIAAGIIDP